MFKFRKIPKYTIRRPMKTYPTETTEQQLRIMRAHMAGITTEISNIRVMIGHIETREELIYNDLRRLRGRNAPCCGATPCQNADPLHRLHAEVNG